MKGYMESGEFSRGKESIRADGSIVLVERFDVDVEHQQRIGHLFGPLHLRCVMTRPLWTVFMPISPGWDVSVSTDHFGLVNDFLSECLSQLRSQSRVAAVQDGSFGGALSGSTSTVYKTISGLLAPLPNPAPVPNEYLEWSGPSGAGGKTSG